VPGIRRHGVPGLEDQVGTKKYVECGREIRWGGSEEQLAVWVPW
jgi:hypothetical protein